MRGEVRPAGLGRGRAFSFQFLPISGGESRGVAQRLKHIFALQIGVLRQDFLNAVAPIWPTIIPTVTRMPRTQGFPPMTSGSCVMRSSCAI